MQGIIVSFIVALAAAYLVRRFYRGYKTSATQTNGCDGGCGCSGCEIAGTCRGAKRDPFD